MMNQAAWADVSKKRLKSSHVFLDSHRSGCKRGKRRENTRNTRGRFAVRRVTKRAHCLLVRDKADSSGRVFNPLGAEKRGAGGRQKRKLVGKISAPHFAQGMKPRASESERGGFAKKKAARC